MKQYSELWFIRDGEDVSGPFTYTQLDAKRRRGDLQWYHEVSQDRSIWVSASTLTDPSMNDDSTPRTGQKTSSRGKSGMGKTALMGVGGVAMLLGAGWYFQGGIPGFDSQSRAAAILQVLQENDGVSKETVTKVGIKDTPSVYAQTIEEYVSRMSDVNLSGCPADFRVAFKHHLESWLELREAVRTLPDGFLEGVFVGAINGFLFGELDGGMTRMAGNVKQASKAVKHSFQDVEKISAEYDVVFP